MIPNRPKLPIYIFDLDGTLADVTHRLPLLEIMGENNFIIAQFRADTVLSITNGQYLFRDSSWR